MPGDFERRRGDHNGRNCGKIAGTVRRRRPMKEGTMTTRGEMSIWRMKPQEFAWRPEDQATYAKWRRGILAFYGCAALAVLVTFGAHHFARDGREDASSTFAAAAAPAPSG